MVLYLVGGDTDSPTTHPFSPFARSGKHTRLARSVCTSWAGTSRLSCSKGFNRSSRDLQYVADGRLRPNRRRGRGISNGGWVVTLSRRRMCDSACKHRCEQIQGGCILHLDCATVFKSPCDSVSGYRERIVRSGVGSCPRRWPGLELMEFRAANIATTLPNTNQV